MADWFIATEGVKVVKDSASLWPQVLTAAAAFGGVWYGQWLVTQREKKAATEKLAIERLFIATELVILLEMYAEGCARVATDNGEPDQDREYIPAENLPELNIMNISGDWRALPSRIMYRIRELPLLQDEACRAIAYADVIPNPPKFEDYFRERQYQFARLGIKAVILAVRLRRANGLPETRLAGHEEWSAVSVFRKVWRREMPLRAAQAVRNREWNQPVIPQQYDGEKPTP